MLSGIRERRQYRSASKLDESTMSISIRRVIPMISGASVTTTCGATNSYTQILNNAKWKVDQEQSAASVDESGRNPTGVAPHQVVAPTNEVSEPEGGW